jgi:hypothetical protein
VNHWLACSIRSVSIHSESRRKRQVKVNDENEQVARTLPFDLEDMTSLENCDN